MNSIMGGTTTSIIIVLGFAISGLAAFVSTYDAIFGIRREMQRCQDSSALRNKLNVQFIVLTVLAILLIVAGIALAVYTKSRKPAPSAQGELPGKSSMYLTVALVTFGIVGLLYALMVKFRGMAGFFKLGISWIAFICFLVLVFMVYKARSGPTIVQVGAQALESAKAKFATKYGNVRDKISNITHYRRGQSQTTTM